MAANTATCIGTATATIEVNGERIEDFESARRAIFGSRVGDVLDFTVARDGAERHLTITVGEAPEREE